ncbi:MAG: putative hydroxymethylpyrimidine transport system ATP-binding protein [Granulosicoccus sp.]|jgi:putative hydroxymethylpyrimidine transport system ATP-binding protein
MNCPGPGPGIVINAVALRLQTHAVFNRLSLTLSGSEFHCVLGRSGVGKTSLLNLIAGSVVPDSGQVTNDRGESLEGQVAYMFQDDGLLPWLTVLDNVQMGVRLRGERSRATDERAQHLLSSVGLSDWASALPGTLSGGMRQRVALARTLMEQCPVILMDEPFSKLDAITREELQVLACDLLKGKTVVMVTHDPSEALRIAHTIVVMHSGSSAGLSTFRMPSEPFRARDHKDVLNLQSELWNELSGHDLRSEVSV